MMVTGMLLARCIYRLYEKTRMMFCFERDASLRGEPGESYSTEYSSMSVALSHFRPSFLMTSGLPFFCPTVVFRVCFILSCSRSDKNASAFSSLLLCCYTLLLLAVVAGGKTPRRRTQNLRKGNRRIEHAAVLPWLMSAAGNRRIQKSTV